MIWQPQRPLMAFFAHLFDDWRFQPARLQIMTKPLLSARISSLSNSGVLSCKSSVSVAALRAGSFWWEQIEDSKSRRGGFRRSHQVANAVVLMGPGGVGFDLHFYGAFPC